MEFDADTRPFASLKCDAPSSESRRRRDRRVCVYVCVFTRVICNVEYILYICIQSFSLWAWRSVAISINHRYLASRMS